MIGIQLYIRSKLSGVARSAVRLYRNLLRGRPAMTEENFEDVFAQVRSFGWDPAKRDWTLREREIDFDDMRFVFQGPATVLRSDRKGEVRYKVFGFFEDVEFVVICTLRGDLCWIISARRARRDERKKYHDRLPRRSAEGQDEPR